MPPHSRPTSTASSTSCRARKSQSKSTPAPREDEVDATIEFNKAEGVDSIEGADPGDYVYFAISELNDDTSNDVGDIQLERVDGGVVYRAELEEDCNVSTLEPVIVGPDGSDPTAIADDALINIDNVYVMGDGRVLCCEDADQFGRSYSNDCLYVYRPD